MKHRREIAAYGLVVVLCTLCAACSRNTLKKVDGHAFAVPSGYLIQPNIPWLPTGQREGLMFVLNPAEPAQKQCPSSEHLAQLAA
jgi:predicted small secreted protein